MTANPALARYATRSVPRYTSYPTAPHFNDGVGPTTYSGWLERLDPADAISLYLHVPFCRQLCWYCGCNMKLAAKDAPIARYAQCLNREIALIAARLPGRMTVGHLHWGGGTPTALAPDDLERAMAAVAARFDFAADAELAIESDPRTLTAEMIARIGRLGFTRASFGVQEFAPEVQAAINRIQPPDMVKASVDGLREAGVDGINFDLIYGLPKQTTDSLRRTIDLCVEMRPDRIALFGYAHVPWFAKKQRLIAEADLPGAAERLDQAQTAANALVDAGYLRIGLDHFALPEDELAEAEAQGTLRRNFQGYTTDAAETLLGFGASSIGRTPFGYFQNLTETGAWARSVEAGEPPIGRGRAFAGEDRLRSWVIEQLMCFGSVDLTLAGRRFGAKPDWWADAELALADMRRDGLLTRNAARIALTDAGKPYARVVASAFDAYLAPSPARHAVAV
ncbi:MAG: oxygen-independent coproporphyrinogen III oxidase [Pseudomonadota bacterium]